MAEVSTALRIVLQMPLGGTLEQPGQWAPREFRAVFLRQVLLDQQPDVGERRELDESGCTDSSSTGRRSRGTKCLAFPPNSRAFETRLFELKSLFPGNGISWTET